jgi:glycosyltransferase involved in cell wall biosynthesis
MTNSFRVVAIISAYNEEDVIGVVIRHLVENGVEVYLMDDHSTDETVAEARPWLGQGLIAIETFPELGLRKCNSTGRFVWSAILRRKVQLARELQADWFIHHDADEFREGPWEGLSLKESIHRVDTLGYNSIDFRVLNFPPTDDGFRRGDDPRTYFRFYEDGPAFDRVQVKCWKKTTARVSLPASGGHEVRFTGRRVFPIQFLLRHYPVRGQTHGTRKVFRERKTRFLPRERQRGWHVQYDDIVDENHVFLRDRATLKPFDPVRARFELLLHNRLVTAAEERLAKAEAAGRAAGRELKAARAELAALSERARIGNAASAAGPATPVPPGETVRDATRAVSLLAHIEVSRVEPEPGRLWGAHVDRPLSGDHVDPLSVEVMGWVLGRSSPATAVELLRNGHVVRRIRTGVLRPDLAAAFPNLPDAEDGGFRTVLSLPGGVAELDLAVQAVLRDDTRIPFATIRARLRWPEGTDEPTLGGPSAARNAQRTVTRDRPRTPDGPAGSSAEAAPRVTVFLTTYNHEPFIVDALETVLGQQTDFEFAVVVLEDCSTDRTREILELYRSRHPERLRLVLAERNLCSNAPLARELAACLSPYATFLDGDDFWSSPHKLQKQVDFLDAHPECAICSHDVTILHEDGRRERWSERYGHQPGVRGLADLLTGNFIPGCSAMVRRYVIPRLPDWFDDCPTADSALYILYAHHGDIGYLPDDMGVYRLHPGGLWTSMDYAAQLRQAIKFYEELETRLEEEWQPILHRMLAEWRAALAALGPEPEPSPWTPVAQPSSRWNAHAVVGPSDSPRLVVEEHVAILAGEHGSPPLERFQIPTVGTHVSWIPSRKSEAPLQLCRTGGLQVPALHLRISPSSEGSRRAEGILTDSCGRGIPGARVDLLVRSLGPEVWAHYRCSGLVPPAATRALVGIRVNIECGTPGDCEIAFREARFVEFSAGDTADDAESVVILDASEFPGSAPLRIGEGTRDAAVHLCTPETASALLNSTPFPVHGGSRYDLTVTAWVSPASEGRGCFAIIFLDESEVARDTIPFVAAVVAAKSVVTTDEGMYRVDLGRLPPGELAIDAIFPGTGTYWPARAEQVPISSLADDRPPAIVKQ